MNAIFRSMVGAAVLVAAGATSAAAQDFTWTLQNVNFGSYDNGESIGPENATATGEFVVRKVGATLTLYSWNITTSQDLDGSGMAGNYFAAGGIGNSYGSDGLDSFLEIFSEDDPAMLFRISWGDTNYAGALGDIMDLGLDALDMGLQLDLDHASSNESTQGDYPFRYLTGLPADCGDCQGPSIYVSAVEDIPPPVTSVPEPASLALLGTGLLGLFAARRRKSA